MQNISFDNEIYLQENKKDHFYINGFARSLALKQRLGATGNDLFATLRLRDRLGRDGCQSALWDCFGGRIFNMAANSHDGGGRNEVTGD